MQHTIIEVNNSEFLVPSDTNRADLERQVLEAVQHNGGFIEISHPAGPPVSVLVTPASTVIVRERTLPDDDTSDTPNSLTDNLDLDLDFALIDLPF
jgi:hypothetical protein